MDISSLTNISSDYLNQIAQQNRLVTTVMIVQFCPFICDEYGFGDKRPAEQRTVGGDPFCIGTVREHT